MDIVDLEEFSSSDPSSFTVTGRSANAIIRELIFQATRDGTNISNVYRETLRAIIDLFNGYSTIDGEGKVKKVKAVHGNQERPIAKQVQEDNLILPIISISQPVTSEGTNRAVYFPLVVDEKLWDDRKQRATRVVSLAPRPIDIEYRITVWSKFKSDLDQIAEQIYLSFNPAWELQTDISNVTKAFLVNESDASEVEVGDRDDRILKRVFTIEVETYVPSPKFLLHPLVKSKELLMSLFFRKVSFARSNATTSFDEMVWTVIPPTDPSERDIYVAASGTDSVLFDATHGSLSNPYKTLSAGKAQIRNGHGDRMWINKGDTFTNQTLGEWEGISGSSTSRPIIVGTYGTGARPIIQTNNASLATLANHNNPANHIWFIGMEATAQNYDPTNFTYGISWLDCATDLLIEDCYIHGYSVGGRCQATSDNGAPNPPSHKNIKLRGCTIADTYMNVGAGDSHGWFFEYVSGVTVEWTTFDKCGYNGDPSLYTIFRHAVYVQSNCSSASYNHNIVCRGDGAQLRPGGNFTYNLVFSGVTSFQIGGHSGGELEPNSTTTFENNVAISGMGWGCRTRSMTSGTLKNNLFIKGSPLDVTGGTNDPYGYVMDFSDSSLSSVANVKILNNNFYDWGGPAFRFSVSSAYYSGITLSANAVQNPNNALNANALISMAYALSAAQLSAVGHNHLAARNNSQAIDVAGNPSSLAQWGPVIGDVGSDTSAVIYVDPTADLASYNAYIGGPGTNLDMINKFRGQSKDNWNKNYTSAAAIYYFQQKYSY